MITKSFRSLQKTKDIKLRKFRVTIKAALAAERPTIKTILYFLNFLSKITNL